MENRRNLAYFFSILLFFHGFYPAIQASYLFGSNASAFQQPIVPKEDVERMFVNNTQQPFNLSSVLAGDRLFSEEGDLIHKGLSALIAVSTAEQFHEELKELYEVAYRRRRARTGDYVTASGEADLIVKAVLKNLYANHPHLRNLGPPVDEALFSWLRSSLGATINEGVNYGHQLGAKGIELGTSLLNNATSILGSSLGIAKSQRQTSQNTSSGGSWWPSWSGGSNNDDNSYSQIEAIPLRSIDNTTLSGGPSASFRESQSQAFHNKPTWTSESYTAPTHNNDVQAASFSQITDVTMNDYEQLDESSKEAVWKLVGELKATNSFENFSNIVKLWQNNHVWDNATKKFNSEKLYLHFREWQDYLKKIALVVYADQEGGRFGKPIIVKYTDWRSYPEYQEEESRMRNNTETASSAVPVSVQPGQSNEQSSSVNFEEMSTIADKERWESEWAKQSARQEAFSPDQSNERANSTADQGFSTWDDRQKWEPETSYAKDQVEWEEKNPQGTARASRPTGQSNEQSSSVNFEEMSTIADKERWESEWAKQSARQEVFSPDQSNERTNSTADQGFSTWDDRQKWESENVSGVDQGNIETSTSVANKTDGLWQTATSYFDTIVTKGDSSAYELLNTAIKGGAIALAVTVIFGGLVWAVYNYERIFNYAKSSISYLKSFVVGTVEQVTTQTADIIAKLFWLLSFDAILRHWSPLPQRIGSRITDWIRRKITLRDYVGYVTQAVAMNQVNNLKTILGLTSAILDRNNWETFEVELSDSEYTERELGDSNTDQSHSNILALDNETSKVVESSRTSSPTEHSRHTFTPQMQPALTPRLQPTITLNPQPLLIPRLQPTLTPNLQAVLTPTLHPTITLNPQAVLTPRLQPTLIINPQPALTPTPHPTVTVHPQVILKPQIQPTAHFPSNPLESGKDTENRTVELPQDGITKSDIQPVYASQKSSTNISQNSTPKRKVEKVKMLPPKVGKKVAKQIVRESIPTSFTENFLVESNLKHHKPSIDHIKSLTLEKPLDFQAKMAFVLGRNDQSGRALEFKPNSQGEEYVNNHFLEFYRTIVHAYFPRDPVTHKTIDDPKSLLRDSQVAFDNYCRKAPSEINKQPKIHLQLMDIYLEEGRCLLADSPQAQTCALAKKLFQKLVESQDYGEIELAMAPRLVLLHKRYFVRANVILSFLGALRSDPAMLMVGLKEVGISHKETIKKLDCKGSTACSTLVNAFIEGETSKTDIPACNPPKNSLKDSETLSKRGEILGELSKSSSMFRQAYVKLLNWQKPRLIIAFINWKFGVNPDDLEKMANYEDEFPDSFNSEISRYCTKKSRTPFVQLPMSDPAVF